MARSIALARQALALPEPAELLRLALVWGCALALILAGRFLPF